jgi:ubiquinone/menaquinone biosynthesis C-methylase UbiE
LETTNGSITCNACGENFRIRKGVLFFLKKPSLRVKKEKEGWKKMAKKHELSKEFVLSLPYPKNKESKEWWAEQAANFEQAMRLMNLSGKETVLDLGAGRCWSTREIAKKAKLAVAMDAITDRFIGLGSAAFFLNKKVFFERVQADMHQKLPFADESFDVVFSTASLHHCNDLKEAFGEIARVLKPKGRLMLANEPVRGFFESKKQDCAETKAGINETKPMLLDWLSAAKSAGLKPKIFLPNSIKQMMESADVKGNKEYKKTIGKIASKIWKNAFGRKLLLALHLPAQLVFGLGLMMVAVKD